MTDYQLARFEVFLQEKKGAPFMDVGSVHAPDAELALLNARDVFVRRPECAGLWIIPAKEIYSRTAEELERSKMISSSISGSPTDEAKENFMVFCKIKPSGSMIQTGNVLAASPQSALDLAIDQFSEETKPLVWWVFPERLITRNNIDDEESFFLPALDKPFRLSTDFHTVSTMRQLKQKGGRT
jgi:ring-1,2-phenylacetyl-CoA epoxidase subunit PaaB